jgi:hypothetical protein
VQTKCRRCVPRRWSPPRSTSALLDVPRHLLPIPSSIFAFFLATPPGGHVVWSYDASKAVRRSAAHHRSNRRCSYSHTTAGEREGGVRCTLYACTMLQSMRGPSWHMCVLFVQLAWVASGLHTIRFVVVLRKRMCVCWSGMSVSCMSQESSGPLSDACAPISGNQC